MGDTAVFGDVTQTGVVCGEVQIGHRTFRGRGFATHGVGLRPDRVARVVDVGKSAPSPNPIRVGRNSFFSAEGDMPGAAFSCFPG